LLGENGSSFWMKPLNEVSQKQVFDKNLLLDLVCRAKIENDCFVSTLFRGIETIHQVMKTVAYKVSQILKFS